MLINNDPEIHTLVNGENITSDFYLIQLLHKFYINVLNINSSNK